MGMGMGEGDSLPSLGKVMNELGWVWVWVWVGRAKVDGMPKGEWTPHPIINGNFQLVDALKLWQAGGRAAYPFCSRMKSWQMEGGEEMLTRCHERGRGREGEVK